MIRKVRERFAGCKSAAYALTLTIAAAFGMPAQAQQYPTKPVRIVVGYPPGGPIDILTRMLTPYFSQTFGVQFLVDNRTGASGMIGTEHVAKSAKDGYTLFMTAPTFAINPSVYPKVNYDPVRDFTAISLVARAPYLLVVHPSFPARTVKELIAVAKARPGEVDFASSGSASLPHLAGELFQLMAGVKMTHIPYKGGTPATINTLAGQVPVIFNNMLNAVQHVKSGRMRALGVTSMERNPSVPDVPTISEAGLKGYEVTGWYGLLGPDGLPGDIVSRLNAEASRVMKLPDIEKRLSGDGVVGQAYPPEMFAKLVQDEQAKWNKVVRQARVKAD